MPDATTTFAGALGREPELRYTANAKAVCSFSVAVERRYKSGDDWKGETTWWNVSVWEALAENCAASLHKGTRVVCTGYPEMREYEAKDGTKGKSLELRADEVAVSLKWARAEVEKVEREKHYKDGTTTSSRAKDPVYGDEEPFVDIGVHDQNFRDMHPWV